VSSFCSCDFNISAQSLLLEQIMNSVRKCNNSAASCSNKARTVFTKRQCRTFTGPRHKAFVNTKIMVFRRRFPCKTINAVFCHHWRQQNSLLKHVCNLEPKLKKLPKVARYFTETNALTYQGTLSVLYIKLSSYHTGNTVCVCFNTLNPELNPICYFLALLGAHHFLHVSRIRVKLLTLRRLMSYIYIWSTHSWCF